MARIRTIKPEFWQDEDIGTLSPNARLLFIASWNIADDEGLLTWTPAFIRAQVFAYDESALDDVRGYMEELANNGFIHPYKDGKGKCYGWIVNFRKHQKIDKPQPSKHPLPSIQNPEIRKVYAERDRWTCYICGGEIDDATSNKAKCFSLDHVYAKSNGGIDAPSNIRACHFGCNSSKKDRPLPEHSTNDPIIVGEHSTAEGNGKDQGSRIKEQGMEHTEDTNVSSGAAAPNDFSDDAGKPKWWPKRDRYGRVVSEIDEKTMFDVGKAVLGKNCGGQVTKLRKLYRGDMRAVTDLLMQADEKSDPSEWFAGVLRKAQIDEHERPKHELYPEGIYRDR